MLENKLIKNIILIGFPLLIAIVIFWAACIRLPIPCAFYMATGLRCPTCGATRAVISIINGDVLSALKCNAPVAILLLPSLACGIWFYIRVLTGQGFNIGRRSLVLLIIILTIFIVFGIVRNIPIEPFTFLGP